MNVCIRLEARMSETDLKSNYLSMQAHYICQVIISCTESDAWVRLTSDRYNRALRAISIAEVRVTFHAGTGTPPENNVNVPYDTSINSTFTYTSVNRHRIVRYPGID